MMALITQCSPTDWVDAASRLLKAVWEPPALDYTPAYLHWQFTRPSHLPPLCFVIGDGEQLSCFVAAIGHGVEFNGETCHVYLSSHFAAARGSNGMNALGVLRAEGKAIAVADVPAVSFAAPGSLGEKVMRFVAVEGLMGKRYGLLPGYMAPARPNAPNAEMVDADVFAAARSELVAPAETLDVSLDRESLAHYETHPWTREFVVARDGSRSTATGIAGTLRTLTRSGAQTVATLSALRVRDPAGLAAMISYTARRFDTRFVSLPVCEHVGLEVLQSVGARRVPTEFGWHLYAKPGARLTEAAHIALEIV